MRWICVAILFPLVQTLHSLQEESPDRKVWLFYWCLYCAASFALYCFEWLVSIPFYVISFYVDIYYETQLLVVLYLVHPKTMGIHTVQEFLETKSHLLVAHGAELAKVLGGDQEVGLLSQIEFCTVLKVLDGVGQARHIPKASSPSQKSGQKCPFFPTSFSERYKLRKRLQGALLTPADVQFHTITEQRLAKYRSKVRAEAPPTKKGCKDLEDLALGLFLFTTARGYKKLLGTFVGRGEQTRGTIAAFGCKLSYRPSIWSQPDSGKDAGLMQGGQVAFASTFVLLKGAHIMDEAEPKIWPPIWVYGINDHLDVPGELPSGFEPTGMLGADLRKLCSAVNAAVHPAFRMKRAREGSPSKAHSQLPSSHQERRRPSMLVKAPDMSALLGGGLGGLGAMSMGFHEEPKPPKEGPNLMVKSFLFDRTTISLIGLLLPTVQNIKVLSFSDCNLDCEMLRLLAQGLAEGNCSVESLQIEWNNLDLPLPILAEEDLPLEGEEGEETSAFDRASSLLEARERKRYTLQSERLLTNFKEWLLSRFGSLGKAWEALQVKAEDAPLDAPDFHSLLFERLGVSGSQVFEVFEVLDGPDYGADGGGLVTLQVLKEALESLPDTEDVEDTEAEEDALGLSLAAFLQPSTVLESVSFRACSITRFELGPVCATLSKCPWQLRALNLWENRICDRGAELLANALDAYRGLEYLGLGRNRITDLGLQALCQPFKPVQLREDTELAAAKDRITKQQAQAKALADAKEKAQAQNTEFHGRQRRASIPLVDELEERPGPSEDSPGPSFFLRKLSELRCLVLSENPIRSADVLETVQPFGPRGADLLLRCTPAATELGIRRPELLKEKERKPLLNLGQNLGHAKDPAAPPEGWVLLEVAQERAPRTSRLHPLPSLPDEAIEAKTLQQPAPAPSTARGGCGQTRLSSRQDGASLQRSGSEMLRGPTLRLSLRNSQKALQQTLLEIRQLNQQKRFHLSRESQRQPYPEGARLQLSEDKATGALCSRGEAPASNMATQRWALFLILVLGLYGLYSVSLLDAGGSPSTGETGVAKRTLDLEEQLEADLEAKPEDQEAGFPTLPVSDLDGKQDEGSQQTVQDLEDQPEEKIEMEENQKEEQDDVPSEKLETTSLACAGPMIPPSLPVQAAAELKSKIWKATREWGYDQQAYSYRPFKGLHLLDIGMGQGPMGVVAVHVGVKSYKGMDPALCINRHAMTRDKRVGRAPNPIECQMLKDSEACEGKGEKCEMFQRCSHLMFKKYREFPFTGVEMMQAFSGQIVLLPGTFATLRPTGLIKPGSFDVATLWLVTEHLPDNRQVIEGIFEWTEPGQLLALKHHNYYGFDGHHQKPRYPEDHNTKNIAENGVVFWKHLEPSSWVFNYTNTNRIRLGDLIALVDVYFECAWRATFVASWERALLSRPELLRALEKRGFQQNELLINKWTIACARRKEPKDAKQWLDSRIWLHPATDGSYSPRPLPKKLRKRMPGKTGAATAVVEFIPSGRSNLKRYLVG
ncbi:unnamed protein product [Symbiodinium sp. CCMP2592]|nr:unnamed protein product [Symbiodinium sp. CCMP2592]